MQPRQLLRSRPTSLVEGRSFRGPGAFLLTCSILAAVSACAAGGDGELFPEEEQGGSTNPTEGQGSDSPARPANPTGTTGAGTAGGSGGTAGTGGNSAGTGGTGGTAGTGGGTAGTGGGTAGTGSGTAGTGGTGGGTAGTGGTSGGSSGPAGGGCAAPSQCPGVRDLGSMAGDTDDPNGPPSLTVEGSTSEWLSIRLTEQDSSWFWPVDLKAKFTLLSPPGVDFDLFVYQADTLQTGDLKCWGPSSQSSTTGTDEASVSWTDQQPLGGQDDSRNVTVEVRRSSGTCDPNDPSKKWSLTIVGNR